MQTAWPVKNIFVISIRPYRLEACLKRLQWLTSYVTIIPACNGADIVMADWVADNSISTAFKWRRGELGCFESHCRIWRHIVEKQLPDALILEDDARIKPSVFLANTIRDTQLLPWDILCLGRNPHRQFDRQRINNKIVRTGEFWGLFAYIIRLKAAITLLRHPRVQTFDTPVDVLISDLNSSNELTVLACSPELCRLVKVVSDTVGIL
jgi:GR25 family glycosyltransferase involved in LPS biosynthesis